MTNQVKCTQAVAEAMGQAVIDQVDAGAAAARLKIYTGSQPASASSATTGTLLVNMAAADPWGTKSAYTVTIDADPDLTGTATGTGTAGYYRWTTSTGLVKLQGVCRATGDAATAGSLALDNTSITSGQTVTVTTWTYTIPGA